MSEGAGSIDPRNITCSPMVLHVQHNGKLLTAHAHATQLRFLHEINGKYIGF